MAEGAAGSAGAVAGAASWEEVVCESAAEAASSERAAVAACVHRAAAVCLRGSVTCARAAEAP